MVSSNNTQNNVSGLWQRFRQGDHALLGEIFQKQYNELYYYGLKLVAISELVKDTIQDIFTDIWLRRQKMAEVGNIKAYLFVSLRRELLHRVQKIRKMNSLDVHFSEPFDFSIEDFIVKEETGLKATLVIVQSLKKLTERQREVILLRFNHELEFQDIAQVLDMNVQSVRNLLFRALENIRADIHKNGIEGISNIDLMLFSIFRKKNHFF